MKRCMTLLLALVCLVTTFAQSRYDVLITELMLDPSPIVGLPNVEWIELHNRSTVAVNLHNWRILDENSQSGPLPAYQLQPDSIVIVCSNGSVTTMSAWGTAIGVTSFPSLPNTAGRLVLKTNTGVTMHAIDYSDNWYDNALKAHGGWSLEMIDIMNACSGTKNWKASIHSTGGTPGQINSVRTSNADIDPPQLLRSYTLNDTTIHLVFNETIDSSVATDLLKYNSTSSLTFTRANPISPMFSEVALHAIIPLQQNIIYSILVHDINDCANNTSLPNSVRTGIAVEPDVGNVTVNEILFDPRPGDFDYIELFNRGPGIVDLSSLYLANRRNSVVASITPLSNTPYLFLPGEYIAFTENVNQVANSYHTPDTAKIIGVSTIPSYPDDEGHVLVLNSQGLIIDEVDYFDDWHFPLINDKEGVSLERIDPRGSSSNKLNWYSASSTSMFGTPGYSNSQYRAEQPASGNLNVTPVVFSPDNDGFDDWASISYSTIEPGYFGTVLIFDSRGRPVRRLVRNDVLGATGHWKWNGLDDTQSQLPIGVYIILVEIMNLQGKKSIFRKTIVLARKV